MNPKTNKSINDYVESMSKPDAYVKHERKALLVGEMIDHLWKSE